MSFLRTSPSLPRHTAMQLSPWLLVGSALILGLAIAFWAVKNTRHERESMQRNLQERAGALMWAMEGGARAGMGMRSAAAYIQFMLEEIAKQKDIDYIALITPEGDVVAHSNLERVGGKLYDEESMEGIAPYSFVNWRIVRARQGKRIFEAYRVFAPLPGFHEHMGHNRRGMGMGAHKMMRGRERTVPPPGQPSLEMPPPFAFGIEVPPGVLSSQSKAPPGNADELIIIVGLDMSPFERVLVAGERSIFFTALLVGLLGLGGIISLFWAQSYNMSRRLLLDTRAFADEVINSLPLGLIIMDAAGRVTFINGVAEQLIGCSLDEVMGVRPEDFQGSDWASIADRARSGEAVLEEEHNLLLPALERFDVRRFGSSIPVSISASRIMNDEGENLGTIYLMRDLREVKRLREELRRSERLSALGNMAARVAHEIRNPLSSIKGFATYLGGRTTSADDKEAAGVMIGEVERLNRVVSELLDFARPSELRIAPADLHSLLNRAAHLAEVDREAKGLELRFAPQEADGAPVRVAVDAERITQALLNLILNAVQATEPGGTITLAVQPRELSDENFVRLTISDTGAGMGPEILSQVFNPFFTTRAKGTGLGLAIVLKIVEDHHGKVAMESSPGKGTTVTVWLPLARGAADDAAAA